ncbi:MAG: hypothetical protein Q9P01_14635 [Anaerolineae bacterium]|nr:hypothetical protein [Anaerolineae bacterium]
MREEAALLEHQFERLFSIQAGYDALDKLIARTYCRKTQLLMALRHPEIELHNNRLNWGFGIGFANVKSVLALVADGVQAWDTFMSLLATTRKLGINFSPISC